MKYWLNTIYVYFCTNGLVVEPGAFPPLGTIHQVKTESFFKRMFIFPSFILTPLLPYHMIP